MTFTSAFFPYFLFSIAGAGGLSANGNMFGNFARWNEPSRDSGTEMSSSKKADYKVVNASPAESSKHSSSLVFESFLG